MATRKVTPEDMTGNDKVGIQEDAGMEKMDESEMTGEPEIKDGMENTASENEVVRFRISKGRTDVEKQDIFVGINGKSYLLKRGVEMEMPKSVVEVLLNAENQNEFALDYMEKVRFQEIK